jgi:hypothetical protein
LFGWKVRLLTVGLHCVVRWRTPRHVVTRV